MTTYTPPSPEDMERLKQQLGMSSTEMAKLFGVSTGRSWRKYTSMADSQNRREMGMHMLFFAAAQLELDKENLERVLNRMRAIGATIDLDAQ